MLLTRGALGGQIAVRPNTDDYWIAYELQQLYGLGSELAKILYGQIQEQEGNVPLRILDLGANIGLAAYKFNHQLTSAGVPHRIVAIEPSPDNFGMILTNLALSGNRQKNIHPVCAGIGPVRSRMHLSHAKGYEGSCTFQLSNYGDGITTDVITFEDIVSQHFNGLPPHIIKCDIEGYEEFLPWEQMLARVHMLYIERHDRTNGGPDSFRPILEATKNQNMIQVEGYGISKNGYIDDMLFVKEWLAEE